MAIVASSFDCSAARRSSFSAARSACRSWYRVERRPSARSRSARLGKHGYVRVLERAAGAEQRVGRHAVRNVVVELVALGHRAVGRRFFTPLFVQRVAPSRTGRLLLDPLFCLAPRDAPLGLGGTLCGVVRLLALVLPVGRRLAGRLAPPLGRLVGRRRTLPVGRLAGRRRTLPPGKPAVPRARRLDGPGIVRVAEPCVVPAAHKPAKVPPRIITGHFI